MNLNISFIKRTFETLSKLYFWTWHSWKHTCLLYMNSCIQYIHDTCIQYMYTILVYNTCIQYLYTILVYNTCIQYLYTIQNVFTCKQNNCILNVFIYTIHIYISHDLQDLHVKSKSKSRSLLTKLKPRHRITIRPGPSGPRPRSVVQILKPRPIPKVYFCNAYFATRIFNISLSL